MGDAGLLCGGALESGLIRLNWRCWRMVQFLLVSSGEGDAGLFWKVTPVAEGSTGSYAIVSF